MTSPMAVGGNQPPGSLHGKYAPANLNLLSGSPPFERPQFLQAAIDIGAIIFIGIFLCAVAISIPAALFLLIFCSF